MAIRGVPRERRVRDYAEVRGTGVITEQMAASALKLLDVDGEGFDPLDRRLLEVLIQRFDGGPAGVESLAAAIGEARDTIEDVIEPFLIQQGFLERTPRGRVASAKAYRHLGLMVPTAPGLFSGS